MKRTKYVTPKVINISIASSSLICASMGGGGNGNGRPAQAIRHSDDYDGYYYDYYE